MYQGVFKTLVMLTNLGPYELQRLLLENKHGYNKLCDEESIEEEKSIEIKY